MRIKRPRHPLRVLTLFGLAVFICALFLLVPEAQTPNALGRNDLLNRLDREVFKKCQLHPTTEACLLNSTIFHTIANEGGNCSLKVLTKNCPVFLMAHRYLEVPVSQEEKAFPLAFSVRMHRSPAQMERLLRAIYRPHNFYCIHVDAKAEAEVYDIIAAVGACVPNVNVLVDRVRISYGTHGDGIVRADLKCMQAALASQVKWMYLLTLCGEEFPLRTNLEIVTILKLFRGANDVEAYQHPRNILRWFFGSVRRRGDVYKNGVLTLKSSPGSLQFVVKKGSAYASYTRQFVQAVFEDKRAKTILGWFNDTFAPEENVWATINAMPGIPGGYPVDAKHELNQQGSRAVVWTRDRYKCKGENVHSVCVFGMGDLPWLSRQPQFFANKFKEEKDSRVLDCLEARLFQRAVSADAAVNYAYFEGLPHVRFYRNRGGPINV